VNLFNVVLVLVMLAVIAWILWRSWKAAGAQREEQDWLPARLRAATLSFSEKKFFEDGPYPLVARVDRAYLTPDGETVLADFKRRSAKRTFESDMVEISAQRVAMMANGVNRVSRLAYVVVVDSRTGTKTAIPIQLEDEHQIQDRIRRFIAIQDGRIAPRSTSSAAICRRCGHQTYCDKVVVA
jgi:CRISPR-associated exonuclease Cas4